MQFYVRLNDDGYIIQRIQQPEDWSREDGFVLEDGQPYALGPVPSEITQRQMRRWLLSQPHSSDPTKTMLDEVNAFINAPTDAMERRQQLIDWEKATVIDRANQLVSGIGAMLGLDSDALDQAFREASLIA
jgi:hypothetical protein